MHRALEPGRRPPVTILAVVRHYLPGYRSGGPARTLANLTDRLGDELAFRIVTADRDALDDAPYADVVVDGWNRVGNADVYYVSPPNRSVRRLANVIRDTPHDILYVNSFFDSFFTVKVLAARRLGLLPDRPLVLAPRGELSPAALRLDRWKKRAYLAVARGLNLYGNLVWQASSEREAADIRRALGRLAEPLIVAPNLPRPVPCDAVRDVARDAGAPLRVVFLGRITPMKNLDGALRILQRVRVPVEFRIHGPIRDERYWRECRQLIERLPAPVHVEYGGEVPSDEVPGVLRAYDLFLLPTRGENYGHAIAEALSAGTPVLIADTTRWRDLEAAGAGWDLPLDEPERFARCIEQAAGLGTEEYAAWRARVRAYAGSHVEDAAAVDANRRLFEQAMPHAG